MNFIIYTPNYTDHCAGIVALHNLAWELKQLGHEVQIAFATVGNPNKPIPFLKGGAEVKAIAIYPEIYPDNPLNVSRVVRWILSPVGEDWKEPKKKDLLVSWTTWDENPTLFVTITDTAVFNMSGIPANRKNKLCYKTNPLPGEIALHDYHTDLSGLSKLLKNAIYLRSGDNSTSVNDMARLCGCPVLLTEADRNMPYICGRTGFAFNEGEVDSAREETKFMLEKYNQYMEESKQSVLSFIERCRERWD